MNDKNALTANGRFGAMAAVLPQTILYKFARYYPAASVVEAATASSRWDVICHPEDSALQIERATDRNKFDHQKKNQNIFQNPFKIK